METQLDEKIREILTAGAAENNTQPDQRPASPASADEARERPKENKSIRDALAKMEMQLEKVQESLAKRNTATAVCEGTSPSLPPASGSSEALLQYKKRKYHLIDRVMVDDRSIITTYLSNIKLGEEPDMVTLHRAFIKDASEHFRGRRPAHEYEYDLYDRVDTVIKKYKVEGKSLSLFAFAIKEFFGEHLLENLPEEFREGGIREK